jgi:hypothetical protein
MAYNWHQFQYLLFYVNTPHDANAAFAIVRAAQDFNDKLVVIDAVAGVVST